jgi:hypothetical protein
MDMQNACGMWKTDIQLQSINLKRRSRRGWENSLEIDVKEIGVRMWGDWIYLAHDRDQ